MQFNSQSEKKESARSNTLQLGVEREMEICHSQPHLVPPMKLVFYDNLPSPGPPPRSSVFSFWMTEGRNLASRASSPAGLATWKKPTKRPTISGPSNFRRIDPVRARPQFRPLELSIYMPGNRLSDLPEFDEFQVERPVFDKFQLEEPMLPTLPPRAFSFHFEASRSARSERRQSAPFRLARKPVGSGSCRSSLADLDQLSKREQRLSGDISDDKSENSNPLIPHFSVRFPDIDPVDEPLNRPRSLSQPLDRRLSELINRHDLKTEDEESIASNATMRNKESNDTLYRIPVKFATAPTSPISDGPSFQTQILPSDSPPIKDRSWSTATTQKPEPHQPNFQYIRSRTLSESTMSSSATSVTGGHRTIPSLSSAITAATTVQLSTADAHIYKEIESDLPTSLGPSYEDDCPITDEGQHGYEYDQRFPGTVVGLAF